MENKLLSGTLTLSLLAVGALGGFGTAEYQNYYNEKKINEKLTVKYNYELEKNIKANKQIKKLKKSNKNKESVNKKLGNDNLKLIKENTKLQKRNLKLVIKNKKLKNDLKKSESRLNSTKKDSSPRHVTGSVQRTIYVEASAYTSFCKEGCTGKTATGINVSSDITHKGYAIIAVDPSVIPLNSLVRVHPKDRAPFFAIAKDTGGAIKGHKIDYLISVNNENEANKFGRQNNVKVEILK